jgi:hypothetical protein
VKDANQPNARPMDWVTLNTFGDSDSANIAKLQLDDAGIPYYLDNETAAVTLWYMQTCHRRSEAARASRTAWGGKAPPN